MKQHMIKVIIKKKNLLRNMKIKFNKPNIETHIKYIKKLITPTYYIKVSLKKIIQ